MFNNSLFAIVTEVFKVFKGLQLSCVLGFLNVIPRAQYYYVSSFICSSFYVPTFSSLREIVTGSYVPFLQFCFIWWFDHIVCCTECVHIRFGFGKHRVNLHDVIALVKVPKHCASHRLVCLIAIEVMCLLNLMWSFTRRLYLAVGLKVSLCLNAVGTRGTLLCMEAY